MILRSVIAISVVNCLNHARNAIDPDYHAHSRERGAERRSCTNGSCGGERVSARRRARQTWARCCIELL
jgi:hypothetical protein